MSELANQHYLLTDQYKNASKLNARIYLHQHFSTNPRDWHEWVFESIKLTAGDRVLELGSGSGMLWLKNLARLPQSNITLSDFSEGMLQEARHNLLDSGHTFTYQIIDAQAIPYEAATFDKVIANHMLYHVPDRARAIAEIRRVLKPAGYFYAATNGVIHLQGIKQLMQSAGLASVGLSDEQKFTLENGAEQLESSFEDVQVERMENNALVVTEVEPLLAFIRSSSLTAPTEEQEHTLRDIIAQEIAERGAVHIPKDSGLFIAYGMKQ
ncbi:SAM-dependent methyltransferase [Reticulibacter mediterranei]|uniref:SAM-dependent methyltransferase n=1 Tax=Reticulibacter mediterranei TaxID=2778369 RepID=A0A8J3IHL9_9CHLR|nr:class I SAM-dependent methyltransferase [Reticulibacter mediterranei]GHO92570.1 SAM-dependent methyltransferase [Reticulibacter mediterranei]